MSVSNVCVGVDGSAASLAALKYALEEATARGIGVTVVTAWSLLSSYRGYGIGLTAEEQREREDEAGRIQERAIDEVVAAVPDAPAIESRVVRCARPWEALIEVAESGGLLVVGTEHEGILKQVGLGSIGGICARRSTVPVVVVPAASPTLVSAEAAPPTGEMRGR